MELNEFDIVKFMKEIYPVTKENPDIADSMRKQIKGLLNTFSSESKHILSKFPLDEFEEQDVAKLLTHILQLKQQVSREVISDINKISADKDLESWKLQNESTYYKKLNLESKLMENRFLIRHYKESSSVISKLKENNKIVLDIILEQKHENAANIEEYISYVQDELIQILIYWIVTNENIEQKDYLFNLIKESIRELEGNLDLKIAECKKHRKELKMDDVECHQNSMVLEDTLLLFLHYVKNRNYYGEYIRVFKLLKEEEEKEKELFLEVKPEYKAEKILCDPTTVENILTEGKHIDGYKDKLNETQTIIEIFRIYGGREAYPNCLQDLKVYFREIFISRSKYKTQARTIARNYLKKCKCEGKVKEFERKSEYIFFREKISRGYFREKNLLCYYNKKNEIQEMIFRTLGKVYLLYDYPKILSQVYQFNYTILEVVDKFLDTK